MGLSLNRSWSWGCSSFAVMPKRGRIGLRRCFSVLVALCLALVTANFLLNHPVSITVVASLSSADAPNVQAADVPSFGSDKLEVELPPEPVPVQEAEEDVDRGQGNAQGEGWSEVAAESPHSYASMARHARRGEGLGRSRTSRERQRHRHHQHHRHVAESWAKLLVKTSMSADLDSVCAHPGASERPMDGDVPPETLSLVRQCVRAVIAQSFPYDRESLTPVQVRAVVATKCGLLDLGAPALREIVFEELSHVADDEALRAAQAVFMKERESMGVGGGAGAGEGGTRPDKADEEVAAELVDDEVGKRAARSWTGKDSRKSKEKSAEYQKALGRTRPYFRAAKAGVPLILNRQLFDGDPKGGGGGDDDDGGDGGTIAYVNFTSVGEVGSVSRSVGFPSGVMDRIPEQDELFEYETCAVVSNNNVKRAPGSGAKVDLNDCVIRLDHAPISGYEDVVGKKTTFDLVSLEHAESLVRGKNVPASKRLAESKMVATETHSPRVRSLAEELLRDLDPAEAFYHTAGNSLLSPQFSSFAETLWWVPRPRHTGERRAETDLTSASDRRTSMWDDLESVGFISKSAEVADRTRPTLDFIAVLFALQVCDRVHLYGFLPSPSEKTYFGEEHESADLSLFHSAVAFYAVKHMAIWPGSDAYKAVTLHRK